MTIEQDNRHSLTSYGRSSLIGAGIGGGFGLTTFVNSDKLDRIAKSLKQKSDKAESLVTRLGRTTKNKQLRHAGNWTEAEYFKKYPTPQQLKKIRIGKLANTIKRFNAAQALGSKEISATIAKGIRNNPIKLVLGTALVGAAIGSGFSKEAMIIKSFSKTAALDLSGIANAAKIGISALGKGITGLLPSKAANILATPVEQLGIKATQSATTAIANKGISIAQKTIKPQRAISGGGAFAVTPRG